MTVTEARERIDAAEFGAWQAFYRLEPFGEERADLRNAMLCLLVASFGGSKRGRKPKLADFMLFEEKPEQSGEEMQAMLKLLVRTEQARAAKGRKPGV